MAINNNVFISGYLGADPTIKLTANNSKVATFSVATSSRGKDGEDETQWHSVVCFGKMAENVESILRKGCRVNLSGEIKYSTYEKDGVKMTSTQIVCWQFDNLTPKSEATTKQPEEKLPF